MVFATMQQIQQYHTCGGLRQSVLFATQQKVHEAWDCVRLYKLIPRIVKSVEQRGGSGTQLHKLTKTTYQQSPVASTTRFL